jgi:hypothetical protein
MLTTRLRRLPPRYPLWGRMFALTSSEPGRLPPHALIVYSRKKWTNSWGPATANRPDPHISAHELRTDRQLFPNVARRALCAQVIRASNPTGVPHLRSIRIHRVVASSEPCSSNRYSE